MRRERCRKMQIRHVGGIKWRTHEDVFMPSPWSETCIKMNYHYMNHEGKRCLVLCDGEGMSSSYNLCPHTFLKRSDLVLVASFMSSCCFTYSNKWPSSATLTNQLLQAVWIWI